VVIAEYWRHQCFLVYNNRLELGNPDPDFIAEFKQRRHLIQIVYGHFEFGIHEFLGIPPCYATILREPISRVISFYYHVARDPNWPLYPRIKEGVSLKEFVASRINEQTHNYMTRILAGVPPVPAPTYDRVLLDRAKENLDRYFCAVGTVDSMGEVLRVLGQRFGWRSRSIPTLNVMTQPRPEIDSQTRDIIAEHNRLDIELYQWVVRRGIAQPNPSRQWRGHSVNDKWQ
jgi:hypothetical protein